jgi:hypothetical protein
MYQDDVVPQKIVIGKTWFYVALLLIVSLLIYSHKCHQEFTPKRYKEPDC